ncbi:hypothetical protein SGFS_065890 [Streptomyces graminofaciens]|uniref:Phage tail protein n=1 Tax=Streptomyces graminofaciens TaxID=68212 RepID=A0ABN5VPN8_9ACTN|nr:hypothetical protein [Streptomyces graminofaciens]BBC35295.1 hypothetical protein SGFS_065890 [Streptomyces graminofaciens]
MGNDIEIRVRVTNQTQAGLNQINTALRTLTTRATAAAAALNRLEQQAEDATRALRRLARQADDTAHAMSGLSTSVTAASNGLRTFNTRAGSTATRLADLDDPMRTLRRDMDDLGGSIDGVNDGLVDLRGGLGRLTGSSNSASSSLGGGGGGGGAASGGGGLTGSLIGIGAAIGASVLPSIGALSPMLFGLAGVGGAAALAMDDLKKEFKKLKPEFEDLQKVASKAVMPGVKKSMDDWRGAMKGLNPVVREGGKAFGDFVKRAADFANSPAFKSSLLKNVEMGSGFFKDFTNSLFDFTQAFLDFGTKSQPSLDAFQNLFGGLLDRGLPSMFKEMEQGIGGSADVIDGLAYLINDSLLPSLGKIAGSFADAFGPLIGEMLVTAGNQIKVLASVFEGLMVFLRPLGAVVADVFRSWNEIFAIGASVAGDFAKEVGGALFETLAELAGIDTSKLDDGFYGLSNWVKENQGQIRGAFLSVAEAITTMVTAGIEALPLLFAAFQGMTEGVLLAIDGLVSGLATAFGDLPVIGDKFEEWNTKFDDFSQGFRSGMDDAGSSLNEFVDKAVPRLNRAQIKMNVDQAEASLEYIKEQLKDPELTRERKAKLKVEKKDAEEKLAAAKRELAAFDKKQAQAKLDADSGPFASALDWVKKQKIPKKTGQIGANTGGFWASVNALRNKVLGTSYINVKYTGAGLGKALDRDMKRSANGNIFKFFADGGTENHVAQIAPAGTMRVWAEPETGGEAYIPLADSKRGRSTSILAEVAEQFGYRLEKFASGGVRREARQARGPIRAATSGDTERSLLRLMDTIVKGHMKMATALSKVNSALDKAKDKLGDLRSAASQLRESVRSGILSAASITRDGSGGGAVTVRSIMGGLVQSRDKSTAFADALKRLRKRGLNKGLLRQIAESGIDGGGLEAAGALLTASGSELRSVNSLQSQISGAASRAGKTTSDALYGQQVKVQERLVRALDDLADELKKASKSKKSAGRKAAGGIVGAAASGGLRGGLTWVGEHEPELVDLPVGSRVRSGPDSRRIAAAAAGSGQPIIVHQTITLDGRIVAQQIFEPLKREVRNRGGLEPAFKTTR